MPSPASAALAVLALLAVSGCSGGHAAPEPDASARPNFLLVSLDTCRYDRTGLGGNERATTPNLDRLAAQGVSFSHAYAQSNETLYSHASIFTAQYPGDLARLDDDFVLPSDARTLADVAQTYGYTTAGFTGGAHIGGSFGLSRGFEIYRDDLLFGSFHTSVAQASEWLASPRSAPFLLFVHGYDCHSPYINPLFFDHLYDHEYSGVADTIIPHKDGVERIWEGRWFQRLRPTFVTDAQGKRRIADDFFREALPRAAAGDEPWLPVNRRDLYHVEAHYDGGLRYADLQLGLLLARLDELELADDTVVIVFADHGEGLTDYGHFHHRPHLHENVIRVPLVVADPRDAAEGGRVVDGFVRTVDITPTVLDMAGIPALQGVPGRSLRPQLEGAAAAAGPVFSQSRHQVSIRVPGEQLIMEQSLLHPDADPEAPGATYLEFEGELGPDDHPPVGRQALELRLRAWAEGLTPTATEGSAVDEELRQALRERGYW